MKNEGKKKVGEREKRFKDEGKSEQRIAIISFRVIMAKSNLITLCFDSAFETFFITSQ
jgi:hypothetical protein